MHADQPSISFEKVGLACARSVISAAHVGGNDGYKIYSASCAAVGGSAALRMRRTPCGCYGRRNSLREGFFDKLSRSVPQERAD